MVKERLESIAEAWSSFVVEFPSCPKIKTDTGENHQKILFLCAATEKNPAELCFAFFGPQILLRRLHDLNGDETTADARLIFVYAAEVPATLKATLDYYQGHVDAPVLVAQRTNVRKSAQHVLEFLTASGAPAAPAAAELDPGLVPLPSDVPLWQGPLPEVVLENAGEDGDDVVATSEIQDFRAEYACRYVLQNYSENINRDRMAEMVHLSPGYFSNLFRVEVGMSFSDYLIQIRIDNAKRLLRRFDLSVEEVSKQCGFNSLAHFSRTFKDRCGMPPLKFRKSPQPAA
ncbi:MAG TPA: AraC family transcriptional regulator [Candidatus Krumholzibacteria bacterium]|nr:AraC family transcriptional regulator [Candidatus Krumholzibacteria bacterium]